MKDHSQRIENQNKENAMLIKVNCDLDLHSFNDAVQTDEAVIFNTVNSEPLFEQNMISFLKDYSAIKNIFFSTYYL